MHDLLSDPLIRVETSDGARVLNLPALLAALARDEVRSIVAVRAHQRHTVHATLVQIAAIAMHSSGQSVIPVDETQWRDLILGATPTADRPFAWHLVTPVDRPAFLQTAVETDFPERARTGKPAFRATAPGDIDILVSSRNHDVKIGEGEGASIDDWLMALISIQTQAGYDGKLNFGVVRMNGGLGARSGFSLVPPGGQGAAFRRDLAAHLRLRRSMVGDRGYLLEGGLALTWLRPWSGKDSIAVTELDPFFIETCRRLRLVDDGAGFACLVGNSAVQRIDSPHRGDMGDLWTVVAKDVDGSKAFTGEESGLHYRRLVNLMFGVTAKSGKGGNSFSPSPLSARFPDDPPSGMFFLGRSLVRGQGKTEGYSERRVPISKALARTFGAKESDPFGALARRMVEHAATVQNSALGSALAMLASGGKQVDFKNKADNRKRDAWTVDFAARVDGIFFERYADYCDRLAAGVAENDLVLDWQKGLFAIGESALERALEIAVLPTTNALRAESRARSLYKGSFNKNFPEAGTALNLFGQSGNATEEEVDTAMEEEIAHV